MKRILSLFILVFGVVLLAGCGKKGPVAFEGKDKVYVRFGDPNFDIKAGLAAVDEAKGDVLSKVTYDQEVDVNQEGEYVVTFSVKASNGEMATHTVTFIVKKLELQGGADARVVLGSYQFDPMSGIYVVDPVDGRITKANAIQAEITYVINKDGLDEPVESVDTKELGEYTITYTLRYRGSEATVTRRVVIVDEIMWTGVGETELEVGNTLVPLQGVKASQPIRDDEGNATTRDVSSYIRVISNTVDNTQPGQYEIVYKILDPEAFDPENPDVDPDPAVYLQENGEDVSATRIVNVVNKIVISGAGNASITKGSAFNPMEGVSARDSVGPIDVANITFEGTVDTTTLGEYTLTYTVIGAFGTELTHERVIKVIPPMTGKVNIYFMSGDPRENDPFNQDYTGSHQVEKQQLHREVEERYNVKVTYVPYPANAAWGPSRIQAMIEATVSGSPLADVYYHISSDWIPQLANGGAIGTVDEFLAPGGYGEETPESTRNAGKYARHYYGFSPGGLGMSSGYYYNADLVAKIGLPNPTQMYLDGEWSWSTFKAWALQAKTALAADEAVLGGYPGILSENLLPLNGADFLDEDRGRILFHSDAAMETYAFVKELYDAQLFEASPAYDAGSVEWKTGKVIFHPGEFWFVNADNRWKGNLNFELGFVPYPMSDAYKASGKPYRSPVQGPSLPVMAGGMTQERKELVFKVWWDMQRRIPKEQAQAEYRILLESRFEKTIYVDAFLSISDCAYRTVIDGLGISKWSTGSYLAATNVGIREGTYDTLIREILPAYQDALRRYLEA